MKKQLAASIFLAFWAILANHVNAAGLGEFTLRSSLNEPLRGEIQLLNVSDLNEGQIRVNLASNNEFERAGIDRVFFLSNIKFEVELLNRRNGVIHVSSERPVKEPYLDFLLELHWPTGRVLRNYTVLLDLPMYSGETAPEPESAPAPAAEEPVRTRAAGTAQAPAGDIYAGDIYRVARGDTLWGIATRLRVEGTSVQQTMMAIHRLNPEAFIRGNINLLRAGAELRVPDTYEITRLSTREAMSEVQEHTRAWRSESSGVVEREPESEDLAEDSDTGVLRLTEVEDADYEDVTGEGYGGAGGSSPDVLSRELNVSEEQREALERENQELRERLSALEEQSESEEKLVSVRDDELAALEDAAAGEGEERVDYNYAETEKPAQTPSEQAPPTPVESSLLDKLLDNALALGGIVVAVIAAVAFMVFRRRREEEEELPPLGVAARQPVVASTVEARPEPEYAERPEEAQAAEAGELAEEIKEADEGPGVEDALAEAEIYLAYGRIDAAMELLTRALETEPAREDLRLKLLEICVDENDQDAFLTYYQYFVDNGDAASQAAARSLLTGAAQAWFDEPAAGADATTGEIQGVDDGFDLDQQSDEALEDEIDAHDDMSGFGDELDLGEGEGLGDELDLGAGSGGTDASLDLDQELDATRDEVAGAPGTAPEMPELDLGDELDEALAAAPAGATESLPTGAEEEIDLFDGADEVETKLELARAYIEMGDVDGARDILDEVVAEGSDEQQAEAKTLLEGLN